MSNLQIFSNSIRQIDNLYSLTDLHKASGGNEKHKPVLFLRLDQTKDLISEIENDKVQICTLAVKTVRGGTNPSTYACMEIALAYAAWIGPKFHLIVLRAYMTMKGNEQNSQQNLPLAEPNKRTPLVIIRKDSKELKLFLRLLSHAHEYSKIQDAIRNGTSDPRLLPICQYLLYQHDNGEGFMFSFKANVQSDLNQASDLIAHIV